ncbi:DeoR/GlpR family DNA-binding transcription regulator [Paenibacillus sacheonensis]|uniref:DeoR family transcriptional regulator n=1 Tax=Paenibacillus sacheonensis TaxID=742054 RepID=A0A7X5BZW3_9BACL|nr:DeoR/GlpR family DNA-binding transcription regulator [Paenibacillus sacheonensis]MBM7566096.1 DeoR/GlpR family transcriptional regulator of sugar metabolism [Paenibacillus sacheonensis]NBC68595.1 DeoR family transcriptional regulator [Paenibacillus sacheonensis]
MSLNERQQQLLGLLESSGEVKVAGLKETFGVTEMTIRRDLEKLELAGYVKRTFGGAILASKDIAIGDRTGVMAEEKQAIGKAAAALVRENDAIFIDGGTTTLQVARHLKADMNITVVTNALNIAMELLEKRITTVVTGGMALEATSTLVGPGTLETIGKMAFDRIFLGATGLTAKHGFCNSNMYEAEIKRMAIAQASEVNIVADHTKYGAKELFSFAGITDVRRVISSRLPDEKLMQACKESGLELLIAHDNV